MEEELGEVLEEELEEEICGYQGVRSADRQTARHSINPVRAHVSYAYV